VLVAIQDPGVIARLEHLNAAAAGHPEAHTFYGAPAVVLVFADASLPGYREDAALVLGNVMNAAHSLGVGSCYIYRAHEEFDLTGGAELLTAWGIPEGYVGIGHCTLGYAEGEAPAAAPRRPGRIIHVGC
jgi:nitroreductase